MDEASILWLLQEHPQYKILSYGSSDEVEVLLVPRDEWPDHHSPRLLVACGRPQENGGNGTVVQMSRLKVCRQESRAEVPGRDTSRLLCRRREKTHQRFLC